MLHILNQLLALFDVELVPKLAPERKSKKGKKQSTKLGSSSDSLGPVSSFRFQTDGNGNYDFIAVVDYENHAIKGSGSFYVYKDYVYRSNATDYTKYTLTDKFVECKYGTYPITPNKNYKVKPDGSVVPA